MQFNQGGDYQQMWVCVRNWWSHTPWYMGIWSHREFIGIDHFWRLDWSDRSYLHCIWCNRGCSWIWIGENNVMRIKTPILRVIYYTNIFRGLLMPFWQKYFSIFYMLPHCVVGVYIGGSSRPRRNGWPK